jgi:hypothetical protein
MFRPIMRGKSYVDETGKSMKAAVGAITKGLLLQNRDYTR